MQKEQIIKILRIVMPIVAITITVIVAPLDLLWPTVKPLPDTVQEQVDGALEYGLDGMIVYVDQAGQDPDFYTAGWKNKITKEPADPEAYFKIASIHKLYIATAIAKLASDETMSLDGTLAQYMPELYGRIEYADQITIRMMVGHRSGIPNYSDQADFNWFITMSADDDLELVLDKPADFEPDAKYSYSNTNYLLLGRIIDRVLGYSHVQYVYEEILAPLGLSDTYFTIEEVEFNDVVSGYWYEYNDDLRDLGGSMIATAEDVGIFLRALNDGSLLNDEEQAIYTSIYEYEHTGWVPGYYSIARYHEDIDTVVIQFVNTTGGETWGAAEIIGGKATATSNIIYNRIIRILTSEINAGG